MLFVINMNSYAPDFQLLPQIPQLNYKFKKLALSPQRMIVQGIYLQRQLVILCCLD